MKYKNVLVLGSDGQIGNAAVKDLEAHGYNVLKYDIDSNKNQDLRIRCILNGIMPQVDFVYFLAFDVGGSVYLQQYQDTKEFLDNNMKIMLYTFESLERYKVPFIFTTTQMANMSYSNYGLLKSIGEKYTNLLGGLLPKLWNVYGVEKDPNKTHVITDFIKSAKESKRIRMRTSGKEERQFLHANDCAACLRILMENYHDIPRDRQLHVTSFKWTNIEEVAKIICLLSGAQYSVGEEMDIQKNKKNEPDSFILNYWNPSISLEQGIKDLYHLTE